MRALGRQVRFTCLRCPLPRQPVGDPVSAYPTHNLNPPELTDETLPAELHRLAAVCNGGRLFYAVYPRPDSEFGPWESSGVVLFNTDEIVESTQRFRAKYANHPWLHRLTVLGRSSGGDLFVGDPNDAQESDVWSVHYLDHEYFFGGSLAPDAQEPIAPSVLDFIYRVRTDPLPFLGSWRHLDEHGNQYYVTSVSFESGAE